MTTQKQIQANKKNALLGGVKSKEGKDISKFNAKKHGILSEIVGEYDGDFYKRYIDSLYEELSPKTPIEEMMVERIGMHYLKLFRIAKAEDDFMSSALNPTVTEPLFPDLPEDIIVEKGHAPEITIENLEKLALLFERYETSAENKFYKAIKEFFKYRALRTA